MATAGRTSKSLGLLLVILAGLLLAAIGTCNGQDGIYEPGYDLNSISVVAASEDDAAAAAGGRVADEKTKKKRERTYEWDDNGYLMFCLCMGRMGNQAEHFLGSLAFAKALNRTFVIPPFISYPPDFRGINLTPFSDLFQVSVLNQYHRVIQMEDFFKHFSDRWSPGKREGQCISYEPEKKTCNHKQGNPFGPFWTHFGVDFDSYKTFTFGFGSDQRTIRQWNTTFSPAHTPVLALPGAPASFPMFPEHRALQKYIRWNKKYSQKVNSYIAQNLETPFLGIHLRNGEDWVRVCDRLEGRIPNLMASPQCEVGHPGFAVTQEICYPPKTKVVQQVVQKIKEGNFRSLFIATDANSLTQDFQAALAKEGLQVKILQAHDEPYFDLAVLGKADHFIGNCVSSFTSFVKRERDVNNLPSSFWCLD